MALDVTTITPFEAYPDFKTQSRNLRKWCIQVSGMLDTNTPGDEIQGISTSLIRFDKQLDELSVVDGLGKFLRLAEGKPDSYDPVAEYAITAGLINDAVALITAVSPKALVTDAWDANGRPIYAIFTPAQTTPFKAALDAIVASTS